MSEVSELGPVVIERPVAGGAWLGRLDDGRVALVEGAAGGEQVRLVPTRVARSHVQGLAHMVDRPSPDRIEPPCAHARQGCGGCNWQHLHPRAQLTAKTAIAADALARIARLDIEPAPGGAVPPIGYRTTVRLGVGPDGVLGYRERSGDRIVPVAGCLVAHPLVERTLARLDPGGADEIIIRASESTGRVLVVAEPWAAGVHAPEATVVGADELRRGRRAWLTEDVAGKRLRVSARSFFQSGPAAARLLIESVTRAVGGPLHPELRTLDLYGGVGLFAATVLAGTRCTLVERDPSAVADARINLQGSRTRIVAVDVRRFRPPHVDVVVADPARAGLGADGVSVVAASQARRVVLVSCDPAAGARDLAALAERGYVVRQIEVLDLFPGTHHLEMVSTLDRVSG